MGGGGSRKQPVCSENNLTLWCTWSAGDYFDFTDCKTIGGDYFIDDLGSRVPFSAQVGAGGCPYHNRAPPCLFFLFFFNEMKMYEPLITQAAGKINSHFNRKHLSLRSGGPQRCDIKV